MSHPDQRLRSDDLGLLLGQALTATRRAQPPPRVLQAVRRAVEGRSGPGAPVDWWTALAWPHGTYRAQLLTWSGLPVTGVLAS